jgi:hypothetical protein
MVIVAGARLAQTALAAGVVDELSPPGSGKAARRAGRVNSHRGLRRMLTANPGRVPNDVASIERGELGRDAPDEVPRRAAAGEEIWHGSPAVLDEMLAIFAPTR